MPLLQVRALDGVSLLIGLPPDTPADEDRAWISTVVREFKSELPEAAVVSARMAWWQHLDSLPLGPLLLGLTPLPDLPETAEETQAWVDATRRSLDLPDLVGGVARFVEAPTEEDARAVTVSVPAILDLRWKLSVEMTGGRILRMQPTREQQEVVEQRLSRLRLIATNREPDTAESPLPSDVQTAVDRAVNLATSDPHRRDVLAEAVAKLTPLGPSRTLAAAMTSLVATELAEPSRSTHDFARLQTLADETLNMCSTVFGPWHEATITITTTLNLLVLRQDHPDLPVRDLASICETYVDLAQQPEAQRSGHLVDILNNLAAAYDGRTDLSRGERQEAVLALFETVEHITRLTQPSDNRTIVMALVNQAAIFRQRIAGTRIVNLAKAWDLLGQAADLEHQHPVLHPAEHVQIATNRLNVAYGLYSDPTRTVDTDQLRNAARDAVAQARSLHQDNETALVTQINTGAVLVDLYVASLHAGEPLEGLLVEAVELLASAHGRTVHVFPAGHRTRLTAKINLASAYGAPVPSGGVYDGDQCAHLYEEVAAEAAATSLDHLATAMTNLGTLRIGQGRWADAAVALMRARDARAQLIRATSRTGTRLGEVVATGDLAARAALALLHVDRPEQAIQTIESNRATLLRHRRSVDHESSPEPVPGRAVVYVTTSTIGSAAIVCAPGRNHEVLLSAMSSRQVSNAVRRLVTAPTRLTRRVAFDELDRLLRPLVSGITQALPEDTTDLCVVACGALAGAPLHAIGNADGRTWTQRWPVRYWPSASVAAQTAEPSPAALSPAIAVLDPSNNLPMARAEVDSVRLVSRAATTSPPGWSTKFWLRYEVTTAALAHLACHATSDFRDPLQSSLDLGNGERLTVGELLDGPDIDGLELVVASACQSGVPAHDAPDELLGIAYGLVHAGAKAAITTLWEVNDLPAALCIAKLYQQMASGSTPARALHDAQNWLAGSSNAELRNLASQGAQSTGEADWLPPSLATALIEATQGAEPDAQPFAHPADWGAFTYLGA